jgi:hypothetical protein
MSIKLIKNEDDFVVCRGIKNLCFAVTSHRLSLSSMRM